MTHQRGFVWWMYLAAAFAVALVLTAAYKYVDTHWETSAGIARGTKDKQAEWDQAVQDQREKERVKVEGATTKHEVQREKTKVVYRTIRQNVDRIVTRDVYRDRACFDDDGVRVASEALRGTSAPASKPSKPVPAPDGADRRPSGNSAAKTD